MGGKDACKEEKSPLGGAAHPPIVGFPGPCWGIVFPSAVSWLLRSAQQDALCRSPWNRRFMKKASLWVNRQI